ACSLVRHGFAAAAVAAISNRLRPTIAALDNSRQLKPLNDGLYIAKDGQCIAAVLLRLIAFVLVLFGVQYQRGTVGNRQVLHSLLKLLHNYPPCWSSHLV